MNLILCAESKRQLIVERQPKILLRTMTLQANLTKIKRTGLLTGLFYWPNLFFFKWKWGKVLRIFTFSPCTL